MESKPNCDQGQEPFELSGGPRLGDSELHK